MRLVIDVVPTIKNKSIIKDIFKKLTDKNITYYKSTFDNLKTLKRAYRENYEIIETSSVWLSLINDQSILNDKITFKQYIKNRKRLKNKYINSYLHVIFIDFEFMKRHEELLKNNDSVILRGDSSYEEYIISNLIKRFNRERINYVIINLDEKNDIEYLKNIIKNYI